VNFYKHHIGDYAQATAHLTFVEDAAYTRMLRKYYAEEKPLPGDTNKVIRLVGARTKEERQAVIDVLDEFFTLEDDGCYHNKRADAEIATAQEGEAEREAKAANERERQRRQREERKKLFDILREYDVVPPWDIKMEALRELVSSHVGHAPVTRDSTASHADVTPPVTRTATANQKPEARSQNLTPPLTPLADAKGASPPANGHDLIDEIKPKRTRRRKPVTDCPDEFDISDSMYDWANSKGISDDEVVFETERCLNHHKAKGNERADWSATWRTWMLNVVRFRKEKRAS
jgi:uncharacterized protein YdaU (DUF1376 family)